MTKSKTCGECKYFILGSSGFCGSNEGEEDSHNDCCSFFEPKVITNGDVIRQMSNEELAKFFGCLRHLEMCPHAHTDYPCEKCNLDYLNAPTESEWKDE